MRKYVFLILFFCITGIWLWATSILSQKEVELKFSHNLHVQEMEIECQTCHSTVVSSQTGTDNLIPAMETCGECHDIESTDNCNLCHSDMENPRVVPRVETYSPKFSHAKHLQAGFECTDCHADVVQMTTPSPYILPDMKQCMNCHQENAVSVDCETCHLSSDKLTPASHTPNFIHNHSDLARIDATDISGNKDCQTCHQVQFCQDCHEGDNLDRFTHPLNFEFTHALEAQGKEKECAACHTNRQFCIDCHRDFQVLPHNHVAGWVNNIPNDGGRHRVEALNDLESCMACHEQNADQICQQCHSK